MNLKKSGRTLVLAAAVAMLAMGLQGCGGDDGVSQSRLDEEIAKTAAAEKAKMEAEADTAEANKAKREAEAAEAAAKKATMEAQAATAAANKAKKEAEAATAAAQNSPENDRLKEEVEAAKKRVKDLQDEAKEAEMKAEMAKDHATAEKLLVVLETARDRTTALQRTTNITGSTGNTPNLTLKSSTLTAAYAGYKQSTDRPREFPPPPPPRLSKWSGVQLESITDEKDVIVVYSNQPAQKKFLRDKYARTIAVGEPDKYSIADGTGGTLRRSTSYNSSTRRFDAPGDGVGNYPGTGNFERVLSRSVSGGVHTTTFRGTVFGTLTGTFTCTGQRAAPSTTPTQRCGFVDTAEGTNVELHLSGAGWFFIPNDANAFSYDPYVYFGWWMDAAPPAGSEGFDAFYKTIGFAQKTTTAARGDSLTGTARYEGGAAGQYAIRALGVENGSESGDFVADVTLNLNFDADATAAGTDTNGITLSGAINNFRADYDGSNKWVVTLSADKNTTTTVVEPLDNLAQTGGNVGYTTKWGVTGSSIPIGEGKWNVDFYGTANNVVPDAAVGKFVAGASNRSILMGAFGATKETSGQ